MHTKNRSFSAKTPRFTGETLKMRPKYYAKEPKGFFHVVYKLGKSS